jgi:hypothetical protein
MQDTAKSVAMPVIGAVLGAFSGECTEYGVADRGCSAVCLYYGRRELCLKWSGSLK